MTDLIRAESIHAELAWAADPCAADGAVEPLPAGWVPADEHRAPGPLSRDGRTVEPDVLRARGAL